MTQHTDLDLSVIGKGEQIKSPEWKRAELAFEKLLKDDEPGDVGGVVQESNVRTVKSDRSGLVPYVLSKNARTDGIKRGKIKKFLPPNSKAQKLGYVLRVFDIPNKETLKLARLREGYVFHAHGVKLPGGIINIRFVGYTNEELTPRANGKLSVKGFAFLISKKRTSGETVHCIYVFNAVMGPKGVRRNLGISDSSPTWTRDNSHFHIHPHHGYSGVIAVRDRL